MEKAGECHVGGKKNSRYLMGDSFGFYRDPLPKRMDRGQKR
jgi:hypothetical protein